MITLTNLKYSTKCSRNFEIENQTDQNLITQNLRHGKEYCILKRKKLLKQCQKEVIYIYILAFAGWWSNFWVVVGGVDIFYLVVCGGGWLWMGRVVLDGGGYILAGDGWWWMVVDGSGWWMVVDGGGSLWVVVDGGGW